jgi:hypothetical protein
MSRHCVSICRRLVCAAQSPWSRQANAAKGQGAVGGKPFGLEAETIGRTLDHGAGSANLGLTDRTCRLDVENDRGF